MDSKQENNHGPSIQDEQKEIPQAVLKDSWRHQQEESRDNEPDAGRNTPIKNVIQTFIDRPNAPYPLAHRCAMEDLIRWYIGIAR